MRYNPKIVIAYFKDCGLPEPKLEYQFCAGRKWRFDFAWDLWKHWNGTDQKYLLIPSPYDSCSQLSHIALEVQGGIFVAGRHSRGAALIKEWEKLNTAACLGWRVLYCQPEDVCMKETVDLLKKALGI